MLPKGREPSHQSIKTRSLDSYRVFTCGMLTTRGVLYTCCILARQGSLRLMASVPVLYSSVAQRTLVRDDDLPRWTAIRVYHSSIVEIYTQRAEPRPPGV